MNGYMSQIFDFNSSQRKLFLAFYFKGIAYAQVVLEPSVNYHFPIKHFTCYLYFFNEPFAQTRIRKTFPHEEVQALVLWLED